jgi:hypothetical protein
MMQFGPYLRTYGIGKAPDNAIEIGDRIDMVLNERLGRVVFLPHNHDDEPEDDRVYHTGRCENEARYVVMPAEDLALKTALKERMKRDRKGHYGDDDCHLDGGLSDMEGRVPHDVPMALLVLR